MTRFVGTPLRGIEFSSVSDEAVSTRVNGDGQPRIRIDAGGRITWSSGSTAGDTNLYRDSADLLTTDDVFKASGGLVTITTDGAPTAALPDGAVAVDSTNGAFYFRSGGAWTQVTGGGGGASITISDTAPTSPEVGDLWFESDSGSTFVYYDSYWVEIGGIGYGGGDLDGLADVTLTSPTNGQVLKYNGTAWVNAADDAGTTINSLDDIGDVGTPSPSTGSFLMWDGFGWKDQAIELGLNTTGNYVSDITAGTGVTVTHTPGEGSSPTIAIGQDISNAASPQFVAMATDKLTIGITGNTTVQSTEGSIYLKSASGTGVLEVGDTDSQLTGNLTVTGNMTVSGTTTTLNTENLLVEDNIVVLNSGVTGSPTLDAGIEVERGTRQNVSLFWDEDGTSGRWRVNYEYTDGGMTNTPIALEGVTQLNNLAGVFYESVSSGQVLTHDGTQWTPQTPVQYNPMNDSQFSAIITMDIGV